MAMRKLVFATNNAHKLEEIRAILGDKVEVLSLKAVSVVAGNDFRNNALYRFSIRK